MPAAATGPVPPQFHSRISRIALGDVIHRSARRFGARTALIEGEHRMTYGELDAASSRFAHHLLGLGLASGDCVGMLCNNSIQMVVAMLGIQKAGLVWVPINTALAVEAVGYILAHAGVRHIVIDTALHAKPELRDLFDANGIAPMLCVLDGDTPPAGLPTVPQVISQGPTTLPDVHIDSTQLALIMYTSGTTGRQKGVMHSHASVHSVLLSNMVEWGSSPERADVWSAVLPLFHCGQHTVAMSALAVGGSLVVLRGFDPGAMLAAIGRHRITLAVGLPGVRRVRHQRRWTGRAPMTGGGWLRLKDQAPEGAAQAPPGGPRWCGVTPGGAGNYGTPGDALAPFPRTFRSRGRVP